MTKKKKKQITETPAVKTVVEKKVAPKKNLVRLDKYAKSIIQPWNQGLVNGFLHEENVARKFHDTKENYQRRYDEFCGK